MILSNILFEITGDDVAQLGDADLRTLIGLLCEADFRHAGLPVDGITWGGHQDAPDGGLDVVVSSQNDPPATSFVKRRNTGIQVKKPDMPPAKITNEMRPDGSLRNEIKELIKQKGSYLIACSTGSTTASALKGRIQAMQDAVSGEPGYEHLHINFLDRGQIATWVRNHPALILWVRQTIGRPLRGWHPYENWAKAPGGTDEEYLLDEGLRLTDRTTSHNDGLSARDGLAKLQKLLSFPGKSVRLAGLSGVGKTRFVQALFDPRLSPAALKQHEAVYTDISEGPVPDALSMLDQLLAGKTRAILIVDNCPPELHAQLTRKCSAPGSTVSLLTVEYDVRDDLPDETDVFRLSPASEKLIEELLRKRYPHINQIDAGTIATFSGGNARLAIALANTVRKGETLSAFREEELFERLFQQRQPEDKDLLISAEVLSLVYSFEGTDTKSDESELKFLASIIGKTPADLYRHVGVLKSRDLIQARHIWRAVLPHAIANRLARRAIASIPKDTLEPAFINCGSERLIKSFSRRLGYLHDCAEVVEMVGQWLEQEGWIGKHIGNLNNFGMDVLRNIAPISPEKVLEALSRASIETEKFVSSDNIHFEKYIGLLRKIAYQPELFLKCARLMSEFGASDYERHKSNAGDQLKSLFYVYLSGTKAPPKLRAQFIEELLQSENTAKQKLGYDCLDATLECWHFSATHDFDFGARPRDFGYQPETPEEVLEWFKIFVELCVRYACGIGPVSDEIRKVLANNFRGLWLKVGDYECLEAAARKIHAKRAWGEGWIAVRSAIGFDGKEFTPEILTRIQALETFLRPFDLLEKARIFAFSNHRRGLDLEDMFFDEENPVESWERPFVIARELGSQVVQNEEIFQIILPELVSIDGKRLASFGEGLAEGSLNRRKTWSDLVEAFLKAKPDERQIRALTGFMLKCGKLDTALYNSVMDAMVEDVNFAEYFPYFQISYVEDPHCVSRLKKSLSFAKANAWAYQTLAYGKTHALITDDDLADLLKAISSLPDGNNVAIEILSMRAHGNDAFEPSNNLVKIAENALLSIGFSDERRKQRRNDGYDLAQIASKYLSGRTTNEVVSNLYAQLAGAISEGAAYSHEYGSYISAISPIYPEKFLDTFLEGNETKRFYLSRVFDEDLRGQNNPLREMDDDILIKWCEINPKTRYVALSDAISTFDQPNENDRPVWLPIAGKILARAAGIEGVLGNIADSIHPRGGWSGSLADILEKRIVLFEELYDHEDAQIASWAKQTHMRYVMEIQQQRGQEEKRNRDRFESFE